MRKQRKNKPSVKWVAEMLSGMLDVMGVGKASRIRTQRVVGLIPPKRITRHAVFTVEMCDGMKYTIEVSSGKKQ